MDEKKLSRQIWEMLDTMEMKKTSLGYNYWLNAILYYVQKNSEDKYEIIRMSEIYSYVAERYKTTISRAEKAMRYAKEESYYKDILRTDIKLKNHAFLILCSEKILFHV